MALNGAMVAALQIITVGALFLTGCSTVVIPPRAPLDPLPVYLLDHGQHSSLVLPSDGGNLTRYSYGDWAWYALVHTGPLQGTRALIGPTQAALGRRELAGPVNEASVRRGVLVPIEALLTINVGARNIEKLRRELDGIHELNRSKLVYNPLYDLEFVPHPEPYSLNHNSNRVVAEWLQRLGCRVRGSPVLSRWKIKSNP
jgi:hypothetical protein